MSRTREFDTEAVLDQMVDVFWRKGYEATSIQDLVDSTRVNRPSLYSAYGDKEQLFLRVLERFSARFSQRLLGPLRTEPSLQKALEQMFERHVERLTHPDFPPGCLIVNTMHKSASMPERVVRHIAARANEMEEGLYQALRRAQQKGQIGPERDARALARFFVATMHGMAIAARVDPNQHALRDIASQALSVVRGAPA